MVERAPRPQARIRGAKIKGVAFLVVLVVLVGVGFYTAAAPSAGTWTSDHDLAAWSVVGEDVTRSPPKKGDSGPRGRLLRLDVGAGKNLPSDLVEVPRCDVLNGASSVPGTTTPIADAVVVLPLTSPVPASLQPGDSATLHRIGAPDGMPVVYTGPVDPPAGVTAAAVAYGEFLVEFDDVGDYAGDGAWLVAESADEC